MMIWAVRRKPLFALRRDKTAWPLREIIAWLPRETFHCRAAA
jgi:hypothetical protein